MAINRDTAVAIINEYNTGDFEHIPLPESDELIIEKGTYLYDEAKKSFEEGMRDNTIQTIIWIGDSANVDAPEYSGSEERDADVKTKALAKVEESYPRRSSGGLSESDERETEGPVVKMMVEEHLPVPGHIEGNPEPLPRDFTKITDKEIRRLSGEYNAYLARTNYLLALSASDLANAEHLLEAEKAKAIREMDTTDPKDGKKQKLAKVIEAEVLANEKVAELTADVSKHQRDVIVLKALKEIYSSNVERLSRDWTMRQNEWEKSK